MRTSESFVAKTAAAIRMPVNELHTARLERLHAGVNFFSTHIVKSP